MSNCSLIQLAESYLCLRVDISAKHAAAVRSAARRLQAATGNGHLPTTTELADWLRQLRAAGRSPATLRHQVALLGALYRHAWQCGLLQSVPTLPRVRIEQHVPEAWTADEVQRLVQGAGLLRGRCKWVPEIPRRLWWQSLLLACWYTAARIGALLAVRWHDVDLDSGIVRLRAATTKSRAEQIAMLPASACRLIDQLPRIDQRVWPSPRKPHSLWRGFRLVARLAGVPCPAGHRQCFHRLRRSALSAVAARDLEAARRLAGHASATVTLRHYVDPRVAGWPQVAVPEIPVSSPERQLTLF